jgi:ketosteroid isomerase-like protein
MRLPEPLPAYFAAANARDVGRIVAFFTADAVVRDEKREHRGHDAIRAWIEDTNARYRPAFEPGKASGSADRPQVEVVVSGEFAGSPARLRYSFRISGGKIARLEIA